MAKSIFLDMSGAQLLIKKLQETQKELNIYKEEVRQSYQARWYFDDLIGSDNEFMKIKSLAYHLSKTSSTILITGESGTGKELFAHAIHNASNRYLAPFVRINCAALPESLLEAELFGYEEGAFTGARKGGKPGKFELANGGTIFLDEIGDMPLTMQTKLLSVLQERVVERVGGTRLITTNVRVIAATNRELESMVFNKEFRQDLYYRLNVVRLRIPPLRERTADIPIIINELIYRINKQLHTNLFTISARAVQLLQNYSWPGNVRELENILERAINLADMNHDKFLSSRNFPSITEKLPDNKQESYVPIDVAMVKVAPMDKHGFFNLGTSSSITPYLCDAAKTVIVEVNSSVPQCLGGVREALHISEIDIIVEGDNKPLIQLPETPISDIDNQVAQLVLNEIEDGACLQLGIGAMPNAIGSLIAQSDLKDLGVHTEMMVDSFVDMYEAGRITGRLKQVYANKIVYTFAMGTNKLYEFLDENPICAKYPVDYTNDPVIIGQNNKVVAINNAVEIDLFGQACAESSGPRQISGTGGQLDFIFGSYRSAGGKGFICLSSTVKGKDGQLVSRIKPAITPGGIITDPRTINYYVVTEYGIAMLKAKTTWQRAEALINIAHPMFRDELIKDAQNMKIWVKTNKDSF